MSVTKTSEIEKSLENRKEDANDVNKDLHFDAKEASFRNSACTTEKAAVSTSSEHELSVQGTHDIPTSQVKSLKRSAQEAELEIDVDAPEPPSKKALRKAKKASRPTNNKPLVDEASKSASVKEEDSSKYNDRSQYGIWVGNLSFNTTEADLLRLLTSDVAKPLQSDQITRVHLPKGAPKFGKSQNKGFAYIDLVDESSLSTALKFTESMLGGRRVLIKNAKSFEGRPQQPTERERRQVNAPSTRIFVGNLDFAATVEDLEAHLGVCGPISNTHMATFEDSGKCKGYAWVEFEQLSSAEKAIRGWIEADDQIKDRSSRSRIRVDIFQKKRLRMEYAESKASRYDKRFGKNAKNPKERGEDLGKEEITEVKGAEESLEVVSRKAKAKKSRPQGKYSEETVQKMTGAIIESKGQRTVFE